MDWGSKDEEKLSVGQEIPHQSFSKSIYNCGQIRNLKREEVFVLWLCGT